MRTWDKHYTGIETRRIDLGLGCDLYQSRNTKGRWQGLIRLTIKRRMLGLFYGQTNHITSRGFEVYDNKYHFGVALPFVFTCGRKVKRPLVHCTWSGSMVDPYHAFTLRVGIFMFGKSSPKWLIRWKDNKEAKKWRIESDDLDKAFNEAYNED